MRVLAVLLAALCLPATAWASPRVVAHDLPLAGRSLQGTQARQAFNLVGIHWQGPGSVEFRTRSVAGRWSGWRPAAPEEHDRPDPASGERSRAGWRLGSPYWTGPSDRVQVRTRGRVTRVRAWEVWSPVHESEPPRTLAAAGSPQIVTRPAWGANEAIRRAGPSYAATLAFAVVHHTAGTNAYTKAQSAAIVRGIQAYHVRGNGWNDVGYNFLVDKYGQVFEGRYGGLERNVVGAHAEGFNTGSVGVAVLGGYGTTAISAAARQALVDLLAWRLDVAHVDPLTTLNWVSGGNGRFPRGVPVFLRAISGHRDTGFTSCPGDALYRRLDDLAASVAATGLPKLYAPVVRGAVGGPVRFTARLSSALPWTVEVVDAAGAVVATGSGHGELVDWTWDASRAPFGAYSWSIESPDVRAASGTLGKAATVAVTRVRAQPAVVSPNGDGVDDATSVSYVLGAPATVTATVVDPAGAVVAALFSEPRAAGRQSFQMSADAIPDGRYRVVVSAQGSSGKVATGAAQLVVSRTLASVAVREAFSPNGDGRLDTLPVTFTLNAPAAVKVRILTEAGRWVATPLVTTPLGPGPQRVAWDGAKRVGRLLDGLYQAEVQATDVVGTVTQRVRFVADTAPPRLRLTRLRPLWFELSEPATVVMWVNGARREVERPRAGRFVIRGLDARAVRAIAYDAAGNRSGVLRASG